LRERSHSENVEPRVFFTSRRCLQVAHSPTLGSRLGWGPAGIGMAAA
jgi:hypothetical protein